MSDESTTLYRIFDSENHLLYVGISGNLGRRMSQHSKDKWWWKSADHITVEHFRWRADAEEAEVYAIRTEYPAYNIKHAWEPVVRPAKPTGEWSFQSLSSGFKHRSDLWLRPELNCESYVDNFDDMSGKEQFHRWLRFVTKRYPDEVANDALHIYWTIMPIGETAPFQRWPVDFLDRYTWPQNDDYRCVDWYSLPVRHDRFPKFSEYLGWTPSPLQLTCPITSIANSKGTWYSGPGCYQPEAT